MIINVPYSYRRENFFQSKEDFYFCRFPTRRSTITRCYRSDSHRDTASAEANTPAGVGRDGWGLPADVLEGKH